MLVTKTRLKSGLFAFSLIGLAANAQAQVINRAKIMQLVPFPKMEAGFSVGFTSKDAPPDDAAARVEIARLEKMPPGDATRLLKLGQLYSQIKDEAHAEEVNERAIAILRKEVAAKPGDGSTFSSLGTALQQNNQPTEAETALREAVKLDPQNAPAWSTLGEVLAAKAIHDVVPTPQGLQFTPGAIPSLDQLNTTLLNSRPKPAAVGSSLADMEEARASYSHALLLAPRDFEVNSNYVGFQLGSAFLTTLLKSLEANQTAELKDTLGGASQAVGAAMFTPALFENMQKLADLKPEDASLQSVAGLASILGFLFSQGGDIPIPGGLQALPPATAASAKTAIARLEAISKAGGKDTVSALESLGCLYFVLGDPAAIDHLKLALSLDPTRQQSYEMLAGILASRSNFTELAVLVETRLKTQDTARNHMLLAKAYDNLDRSADAAAQVDLALKLDPHDVMAVLAKAALWLRAGEAAPASAQLLTIFPVPDGQKSDYAVLEGAAFALQGKLDEARAGWEKVLATDAGNDAAKQMLAALPTR